MSELQPWGNEFDKEKCNTFESGIYHTTPVDKYPQGCSPYGCFGMAGNVLEWTDSWYDYGEVKSKVLRGGSWLDVPDYARCAARSNDLLRGPDSLECLFGFRCVRDLK